MDKDIEIIIEEGCGGFSITAGKNRVDIDQEDSVYDLVNFFKLLGFKNVKFEEVY